MKLRQLIDKVLELVLIVLLIILVLDVLWQVISRYILVNPSSFTDELARFLLIWLGILGSAYVTGKKLHLAIDFFVDKFSKKVRLLVFYFSNIAVISFAFLVMVVGGINLMYILLKLGNISPALSLPIGYVYSVIPLSGIIITYYSLSDIYLQFTNSKNSN